MFNISLSIIEGSVQTRDSSPFQGKLLLFLIQEEAYFSLSSSLFAEFILAKI